MTLLAIRLEGLPAIRLEGLPAIRLEDEIWGQRLSLGLSGGFRFGGQADAGRRGQDKTKDEAESVRTQVSHLHVSLFSFRGGGPPGAEARRALSQL